MSSDTYFRPSANSKHPAGRPRILIVEDNLDEAMTLEHIVRATGCDAVLSKDLEDALRLARSSQIDAAVLNTSLSTGQDVFPLAHVLKRRQVPFLFTTAEDRSAPRKKGFSEITLLKPLERGVVEKMITYMTNAPR